MMAQPKDEARRGDGQHTDLLQTASLVCRRTGSREAVIPCDPAESARMRREAVLRVSMALVPATAALLLALGAQPSAASTHSMTPVARPGVAGAAGVYPPRVTLIADSVGGVLFWAVPQRERLAKGLDFRLEVKTCRKLVSDGCYAYGEVPPSALDSVAALGQELGHLVVVDVGYNDLADGYAEGLDTVMAALVGAGVERVIWVTLSESQSTWVEINDQIRAAPARWPQLVVADWAPIAQREPSWFADGPHMNQIGADGFVDFLRPAIFAACGNACIPPEATATIVGLDHSARQRDASLARKPVCENLRRGRAAPGRRLADPRNSACDDDVQAARDARRSHAGPCPGARRYRSAGGLVTASGVPALS